MHINLSKAFGIADEGMAEFDRKYKGDSFAGFSDEQILGYMSATRETISQLVDGFGWYFHDALALSYTRARKMGGFARELMRRYPEMSAEEILTWFALQA